jgi:hypothetical protein
MYPEAMEDTLALGHTPEAAIGSTAEAARQTRAVALLMLIGVALLYVIGVEQGSILQGLVDSNMVHEFLHDARHATGFACH